MIALVLTHITNEPIIESKIPETWHSVEATPSPMKSGNFLLKLLRPTAGSSALLKLAKRTAFDSIMPLFSIFSAPLQFAYKARRITLGAVVLVDHSALTSLRKGCRAYACASLDYYFVLSTVPRHLLPAKHLRAAMLAGLFLSLKIILFSALNFSSLASGNLLFLSINKGPLKAPTCFLTSSPPTNDLRSPNDCLLRPSPLPLTHSTFRSTTLLPRGCEFHGSLHRHLQDEASSTTPLEVTRTPSHSDQHLQPSNAEDAHLNASSVAILTPAGLFPRSEARPARRAGDKSDLGCRRLDCPSSRHLQDADSPTASQETSSLTFPTKLVDVDPDKNTGIRVAYKTDGQILNQQRMHSQSRVFTTAVHELHSADDCALNVTSEGDMQRSMDLIATVRSKFSLIINTQKPVVMH
nr:unnamed protein product [Spirometra erinaceieuropaei]